MATDKRLDQVSNLTDFDYALIVKGEQVSKISKAELASVVAGLLPKNVIHELNGFIYDSTNGDLNNQPSGSFIFCEVGVKNAPISTAKGYSVIFGTNLWSIQIFLVIDTAKTYIRRFAYNSWASWAALN